MNAAMAAITEHSLGTPEKVGFSVRAAITMATGGDFGLPIDELKRIAENLPANHSAIIGILENAWERDFRDIAQRYGGRMINRQLMSPEEVAKAVGAAAD
jgi:hypothetical protein